MKKGKKFLLILLMGIVVLVGGGWGYIKSQTYAPSEKAQQVATIGEEDSEWLYFPSKDQSKPMIIFYPDALIEPESYSLWAQTLVEAGYPVYLLKMPLNLAVFAPNRGDTVLSQQPKRKYVLGGHSLGG